MKAKPFLGPFQDSSLPVIYRGKCYEVVPSKRPDNWICINNGFGTRIRKIDLQQLYAEVDGKKYLVSYSPSDYPLPNEVEGEVVKKEYSPDQPKGLDQMDYDHLTQRYTKTYFIPKLQEKEPSEKLYPESEVIEILALRELPINIKTIERAKETGALWKSHKAGAEVWLSYFNEKAR